MLTASCTPLGCNLFPFLSALACHHRLCWNLSLVTSFAATDKVGLLLKVTCVPVAERPSSMGDVLAPNEEWWATSVGSNGSGDL